jgi:hypothetical protein
VLVPDGAAAIDESARMPEVLASGRFVGVDAALVEGRREVRLCAADREDRLRA